MSDPLWSEYNEAYMQAWALWQPWVYEAKKDHEYAMGKQISYRDRSMLRAQGRKALVFNRIRKLIQTVSGYQRKNRLALKVDPIDGSEQTAKQFSGILLWLMQFHKGYGILSNAFMQGALTSGLNLVELGIDYNDDPLNGDAKFFRCPYNSFLMDPYLSERDLSDCSYIVRRRWPTKQEAKALLPGNNKSIDALRPKGRDSLYPYSQIYKDLKGNYRLRYDQYYRRVAKNFKLLVNMLNGATTEWQGTTKDLDQLLNTPSPLAPGMNWGQLVTVMPRSKLIVQTAIFVEEKKYYDGPDPTGLEDYPFIPVMGFWDPEYDEMRWKLQGLVRMARDPQDESNKRRMKILDIVDSVISSGVKAKPGSVVDKMAPYQSGQGRVVWMKDEAEMSDFELMQGADVPPGLFQFTRQLDEDILDVLGLNAEILGMPNEHDAQEAYVMAKLRQAAGLTIFQPLFDEYREAKKLLGNKLMEFVQANFSPQKVKDIINEEPTKEFYDKNFRKYDCVPVEGILSDTQKQMAYAQLMGLKNLGFPVPIKIILKYSPLELKDELIKELEAQEKGQAAAAQAQQQAEMIKAKLNAAKAGLTQAQTEKALSDAALDKVKVMAELEGMDHERLMSLLQFALEVEQAGGFGTGEQAPAANGNVVPMRKGVTRR